MSFRKKIWKGRKSEYPSCRKLIKTDGSAELVTIIRAEGQVTEEGDAFSPANMNDLEERIEAEFTEQNSKIGKKLQVYQATSERQTITVAAKSFAAWSYVINVPSKLRTRGQILNFSMGWGGSYYPLSFLGTLGGNYVTLLFYNETAKDVTLSDTSVTLYYLDT